MPPDQTPPPGFDGVSDHDLLAGGLQDLRWANACVARRMARLDEFRRRREADYQARRAAEPHFTLTPAQETVVEAGELWGLTEYQVRSDLRIVRTLREHFPEVWQMCLTGALEPYKATVIVETARTVLKNPNEYAALSDRITKWLRAGIWTAEDDAAAPEGVGLVNRTMGQLRKKLAYELNRLRPRDPDARFTRAFQDRRVSTRTGEDGIGSLFLTHCVTDLQLADYRLTLMARTLRAAGDARTMDQLRADLLVDLVIGRLRCDATLPRLDDDANQDDRTRPNRGDRSDSPLTNGGQLFTALSPGSYARPVINVTVPIQTVMGLSDHPGVLSGGVPVPATLVRMLAQDPESTWYRMLTDPRGEMVELSTTSYRPTAPIWRDVVARHNTCYRRNCDRAATTCELDHRLAWPEGPTATGNLNPGCRSDHKAKHAEGFSLTKEPDGRLALRTRAGFTHHTDDVQHPWLDPWPDEALFETQITATEMLDTLRYLRAEQHRIDAAAAAHLEEEDLWPLDHHAS